MNVFLFIRISNRSVQCPEESAKLAGVLERRDPAQVLLYVQRTNHTDRSDDGPGLHGVLPEPWGEFYSNR